MVTIIYLLQDPTNTDSLNACLASKIAHLVSPVESTKIVTSEDKLYSSLSYTSLFEYVSEILLLGKWCPTSIGFSTCSLSSNYYSTLYSHRKGFGNWIIGVLTYSSIVFVSIIPCSTLRPSKLSSKVPSYIENHHLPINKFKKLTSI